MAEQIEIVCETSDVIGSHHENNPNLQADHKAQVELESIRPSNSNGIWGSLNFLKALQKKKQSSSSSSSSSSSEVENDVLLNALQDIQDIQDIQDKIITSENQDMINIKDVTEILEKVEESFKLASENIDAVMKDINVRGIEYDRKMERMEWYGLFIKYSTDLLQVGLTSLGTSKRESNGAPIITGLVIKKLGEYMVTFLENKIKRTKDEKKKIKKLQKKFIEAQQGLKFVPELEWSTGMVKVENLKRLSVQLGELKPAMEKVVAGLLELVSL